MTKLRAPLSFEDGITRIAGLLGWARAAAEIGVEERSLRAWADPDCSRSISLYGALRADAAYRRAGGEGAPLLDSYALQLGASARQLPATAEQIAFAAARCAKEGGDAVSAMIQAAMPGATPADRALALREAREDFDALTSAMTLLECSGGGAAMANTS